VFGDTWVWTAATEEQFDGLLHGELPIKVAEALGAMRTLIGENDAMAYLVNMAPRLFQLACVLKPTGSLYLHYDPTMSHYLKCCSNNSLPYGRSHDVILFYTRSKDFTWNVQYTPMSGTGCGPTPGDTGPTQREHGQDARGGPDRVPAHRDAVYKRYLDEQPGVPLQDTWTDIRLTSSDKERLGYP
jgi:hypothetical protein